MVTKQAQSQTCTCGQALIFPEGEVKLVCKCGAVWEIDNGGFWFTNLTLPFAPVLAKPRKSHYEKCMERRKKGRKAGGKC